MSGIVSGIGKTFTSVVNGVSSIIGSAVSGVGAIVGTAASAGSSIFGGGAGQLFGGGGVLGNLINGAVNVVSKGLGGLVDTAENMGSALLGPAGATATGSIGGGMAAGAATAPSFLSKAGNFITSETGAGLIGGIGKGLVEYEKMEKEAKERQKDRDYLLAKEMRIRDSYNVPGSALPDGASTGVVQDVARPTPASQYGRDFDMVYDPELGRIVRKARD